MITFNWCFVWSGLEKPWFVIPQEGSGTLRVTGCFSATELRTKGVEKRSDEQSSDVSESFLSSQSHKPFESESSKILSSRVKVMTRSSRVGVESQELSSCFESLVCKLKSMSSHTKFHVFLRHFLVWNGAQHAIKRSSISKKMVPNMLWIGARLVRKWCTMLF